MKLQGFTISDWIYPDSPLTATEQRTSLRTVRNNYACFQVLSDLTVADNAPCSWQADAPDWMQVSVEQMCPVYVAMNSDPKLFTTPNYDLCKDYVVRKAPYTVYERIRPLEDGCLEGGRAAFFVRLDVPADAPVGVVPVTLTFCVNGQQAEVGVELTVHKTAALPTAQTPFHMSNTIYQRHMLQFHKSEPNTQEYFDWYRKYMKLQVEMRCTLYGLNTAIPIRDEEGKVTGFDFSENERMGRLALESGIEGALRLDSPAKVYRIMLPLMRNMDHEECWCLFLNRTNALIAKERMTTGGQDFTLFDKRVIIRRALERKASSVILVHNHPSGNPFPSVEDINQTKDLHRALSSCGLQLLDHVIVAGSSYYSFSDEQVVKGRSGKAMRHVAEKI
jgi:proteasome lid subunit RPN8/RPN11